MRDLLAAETIEVERRGKTRKNKGKKGRNWRRTKVMRTVDIRPMVRSMALTEDTVPCLDMTLVTVDDKPGKVKEILALLTERPEMARVLKRDTLMRDGDEWVSISRDWCGEEVGTQRPNPTVPLGA